MLVSVRIKNKSFLQKSSKIWAFWGRPFFDPPFFCVPPARCYQCHVTPDSFSRWALCMSSRLSLCTRAPSSSPDPKHTTSAPSLGWTGGRPSFTLAEGEPAWAAAELLEYHTYTFFQLDRAKKRVREIFVVRWANPVSNWLTVCVTTAVITAKRRKK